MKLMKSFLKIMGCILVMITSKHSIINAQTVAVSNMRQNVVYMGIENPLKIVVEGANCSQVSVRTENGKITKKSNCEYTFVPNNTGMTQIVVKSNKGTYNYLMRSEALPKPVAMVGNSSGGRSNKKNIVLQNGLHIKYPGIDIPSNLKVKHYSYLIIREGSTVGGNHINGNNFTRDMKSTFDKMMKNDKLLFYSIVAEDNKGDTHTISPIEYVIY